MNKSDLKNFAINARLALLQRVADRAALYGIDEEKCQSRAIVASSSFHMLDGSVLSAQEVGQRNALIARISKIGYRQTMEEAAYTWFNRLIAIRYMQQHSLLPVSMRVLPEAPGALPQILREAQDVSLPGVKPDQVLAMLDANRTDALYRYLLIALCNALGGWLPGMFQQITSVAELLFPAALLKADSVLGEMARLGDDCWNEIQVIGWLYQYYNTQLKDETFELLKKNVKITKDRIGAATQLFTPEWIVNYMVENSLGRLWLEGHPSETLRMKWRYYMDEAPQEPAVAARLAQLRAPYAALQPEQLTVLDPCMGSGHILVYAFDVLMDIYRSVGYTDRDAVQSIVQNNLYGLDIDDRAAQLAYFAVMMKACEYDRRFLRRGVQPHLCAIAESAPLADLSPFGPEAPLAQTLLDTFRDAKEYGSILHVPLSLADVQRLADRTAALQSGQHDTLLSMADNAQAAAAIQPLLAQAQILARQYDAVITNPPYIGRRNLSSLLCHYLDVYYPNSKMDIFAAFIEKNTALCKQNGHCAFMTPFVWLYLSSYFNLRKYLLSNTHIESFVQPEESSFQEAAVTICSFVLQKNALNYTGTYIKQSNFHDSFEQPQRLLDAISKINTSYTYFSDMNAFSYYPDLRFIYWGSIALKKAFFYGRKLEEICMPRQGMATTNNELFLRLWFEISFSKIGFNRTDENDAFNCKQKWFPYNKGGGFRKWYGNFECCINYENKGKTICDYIDNTPGARVGSNGRVINRQFFFKKSITWSDICGTAFAARACPNGFIFDVKGSSAFVSNEKYYLILSFLNNKVCSELLNTLNPTVTTQVGDLKQLPFLFTDDKEDSINLLATVQVSISRLDWDSFETSWDFKKHPMI